MTIDALLRQQAHQQPKMPALVDGRGRAISFADLETRVGRAASWWESRGITRGKAVLVFVPMSVDLYVALLGLFRLGAVALFLDPSAGVEHMESCCERWAPDALLAVSKAHLLRLRSRALRRIPLKVRVGPWFPGAAAWSGGMDGERFDGCLAQPEDAALVTFTSGSTGKPKGAVRTHAFLIAQQRALASSLELEAGEVDLATLPVFVFANLAAGLTTVLPAADMRRPAAVDANVLLAQIERHGVSRITASPAFFERLGGACLEQGRSLRGLRKLYTGGAPVFPRLLEAMAQWAPNARIEAVYGSTEAEPIAHLDARDIRPEDADAMRSGRGLLTGKPVPEISFRVIQDQWGNAIPALRSEAFGEMAVPLGTAGEIVVSGDHVLPGYLGGVGDEETKFKVDGRIWHRTGDAGCIDGQGQLWLLGRCAAKIVDSGGTFYPFGAECVAMTFPAIRRSAFVGLRGRRVLVYEGTADSAVEPALRAALGWAKLDELLRVDAIPVDRRHNAKVDYPALRKLLGKA